MNHEKWIKLSDESKNIKIAELDGWTKITYHNELSPLLSRNDHFTEGYYGKSPNPLWSGLNPIPNYLQDLNAMHKAIMTAMSEPILQLRFYRNLMDLLDRNSDGTKRFGWNAYWETTNATAIQRAEAFVLTMEPE